MTDDAIAAARAVCARAFGAEVELRVAEEIIGDWPTYRHMVARFEVVGGRPETPKTVIVKRSNQEGGDVVREWAALAFLNHVPEAGGIAPRFFGGDDEHELLVLEDLGDLKGTRLRDFLNGDDPHGARDALVRTAETVGRLQAACGGRLADYRRHRDAGPLDFHQRGRLEASLRGFPQVVTSWRVTTPPGLPDDLNAVIEELGSPGPFETLVHGDCCPSNVAFVDGAVRLVDFEVSGPGHALLDGAYARLRHLNCFDGCRIPRDVRREMETAYRRALGERCAAALDDRQFARGMTAACAAWMAVLAGEAPGVVGEDRPRGPASYRQRILAALRAFAETSRELGAFPALGDAASALDGHLRQRWPSECHDVPPFAALG